MTKRHERGIALITTLLVMALMSALLIGFTAEVMSDQKFRVIDRDHGQSFYAAAGGIEKLTVDLGNLFFQNVAPTGTQVTALTLAAEQPVITGVTFTGPLTPTVLPTSSLNQCGTPNTVKTVGAIGYTITFCAAANGNPSTTVAPAPIKTGPYQGLIAELTPYQVDVTAKTTTGGETHLVRAIEAVAIPVFQFGMFSDVDLAFFAGPDFGFGGRVHTNGNLFLDEGAGATLTLSQQVDAVGQIVRQQLQNGVAVSVSGHTGTVNMAKAAGVYRALALTEGSVVNGPTSALNEPTWHTISLSTYNSWIRNGSTGATTLKLPLITAGGSNPDLARRPLSGEDTSNPNLYGERLYTKASIRILLSDTAADITGLPGVTGTAPVQLDGNWRSTPPNNGTAYGPVSATNPPIARSPGAVSAVTTAAVSAGTGKTITFSSLPSAWQMPTTLSVNKTTATTATYTLSCTGKTATTLTGCTGSYPALTVSSAHPTVTGTVTTIDGNTITLPTMTATSNISAGTSSSTITATAADTLPYSVNTFWASAHVITCSGYTSTTLTGCNVPVAISSGATVGNAYKSSSGTGTIGGYLKIEEQGSAGTWTDITMQILNYGIGGPNIVNGSGGANAGGTACADPTPQAILRIQRLRDNDWSSCDYGPGYTTPSQTPSTDYWPYSLFDTREALQRDTAGTSVILGGVMYYVSLDVANLSQWFTGTGAYTAGTGSAAATSNGGYTVYFSDRRNNVNASGQETAEYGWEDFVNPASTTGAPNGALDTGEDVNGNNVLDVYGGVPNYNGTYNTAPPGAISPLTTSATPLTALGDGQAQVNRPILFRRALKLINGSSIASYGVTGLSVVAENPIYVQGNWNANGSFTGAHAATSVIADAVTLLSNGWNDENSFENPYVPGNRNRGSDSWYRMAIIAGKGIAFPWPGGSNPNDFGTDGGAHNFLRYLENGDAAVNYEGSIATFYYNRQAVGTYKCCTTVYGAPTRNYAFDTDFLTPSLMPPNTPVFRDMNTIGFAQVLQPGQ